MWYYFECFQNEKTCCICVYIYIFKFLLQISFVFEIYLADPSIYSSLAVQFTIWLNKILINIPFVKELTSDFS